MGNAPPTHKGEKLPPEPLTAAATTAASQLAEQRWEARLFDLHQLMRARPALSTDDICQCLGVKPPALYQQLHRRGQHQLAHELDLTKARYR